LAGLGELYFEDDLVTNEEAEENESPPPLTFVKPEKDTND
jgi:hypothetical protein